MVGRLLLAHDAELDAAILPAPLAGVVLDDRPVGTETARRHTRRIDATALDEPALQGRGAPAREVDVVGTPAARVAVSFDGELRDLGVPAKDTGDLVEERRALRQNLVAVRAELHVLAQPDPVPPLLGASRRG